MEQFNGGIMRMKNCMQIIHGREKKNRDQASIIGLFLFRLLARFHYTSSQSFRTLSPKMNVPCASHRVMKQTKMINFGISQNEKRHHGTHTHTSTHSYCATACELINSRQMYSILPESQHAPRTISMCLIFIYFAVPFSVDASSHRIASHEWECKSPTYSLFLLCYVLCVLRHYIVAISNALIFYEFQQITLKAFLRNNLELSCPQTINILTQRKDTACIHIYLTVQLSHLLSTNCQATHEDRKLSKSTLFFIWKYTDVQGVRTSHVLVNSNGAKVFSIGHDFRQKFIIRKWKVRSPDTPGMGKQMLNKYWWYTPTIEYLAELFIVLYRIHRWTSWE